MPGGALVGFDRSRLERLRSATLDCWSRADTIRSVDGDAADAMTTLRAATAFLSGPMLRRIDAVLTSDVFARPIAGAPTAIDDTTWPASDSPGGFGGGASRRWADEFVRRIDTDPTVLSGLFGAAERRHQDDEIERVARLAVAGELGSVTALRILASLSLEGVSGLPTVERLAQHDAWVDALLGRIDEVLADPKRALEALEHPEVRTWLVAGDQLDDATTALLIGAGLYGSVQRDPNLLERSRAAWLGFVELAQRFGADRFADGVAEGLAIGAAAHLPTLLLAPNGRITTQNGSPVRHGRDELGADDLATLFGAVVVSAPAASVLFELIHDTAVHDLRTRLDELDRRRFDAEADQGAVAHSLVRSVGMLDLVFDDAVEVQQARWNQIARAEAAERTMLITVLSTVTSLVPGSGIAVSNARTVFRGTLGIAKSGVHPEAERVERAEAIDGFDIQLARELVASIADSSTLRDIVRFDQLTPASRRALVDFAASPGDVDVTSLDGLLGELGIDETDADVIAGQIDQLLAAVHHELEPHRD